MVTDRAYDLFENRPDRGINSTVVWLDPSDWLYSFNYTPRGFKPRGFFQGVYLHGLESCVPQLHNRTNR